MREEYRSMLLKVAEEIAARAPQVIDAAIGPEHADWEERRIILKAAAEELSLLIESIEQEREERRTERQLDESFDRELSFWERVCVAAISRGESADAAASMADAATALRDAKIEELDRELDGFLDELRREGQPAAEEEPPN